MVRVEFFAPQILLQIAEVSRVSSEEIVRWIDEHGIAALEQLMRRVTEYCALAQSPRPAGLRGCFQVAKALGMI
jgi:hypothetical protein